MTIALRNIRPSSLQVRLEQWPLAEPFRISGYVWNHVDVLLVEIEADGCIGRGEAAGVYYRNDKPASMRHQIAEIQRVLEQGLDRVSVQQLLPAGGARNAIDCALWELEAKLSGRTVWDMAGIGSPHPVLTTFTCGADEPHKMAQRALSYTDARAIKLKLTGEPTDAERVQAVREALPNVWLGVDANQGFSRQSLERLLPTLIQNKVALIEQPFPIGQEALLDGLDAPIPIAADESVQSLRDLEALIGRFQVFNIKLDKCGGLTHALAMARAGRELGLEVMVGNMIGTSLAMAPAFVLAQLCSVVDLDGPVFLKADRPKTIRYSDGCVQCPDGLWG